MNQKTALSCWGNYPRSASFIKRIERYHDIMPEHEGKTIARGLGRSYGDAALNTDQTVLLMHRMNRMLAFDQNTGILRAEAGTTLQEILDVFIPRGWFLPVVPGTKFATLGGCFAADIHGKNHHSDGTFSYHVKEIELILADSSRRRCSPERNPALFWATAGGMGLTGIISEVALQLVPVETAYISVDYRTARNLDHMLELLENSKDKKYSVAWIDCLSTGDAFGRGIVMNGRHASKSELPPSIKHPLQPPKRKIHNAPFFFPNKTLNYWSIKAFNACYFRIYSKKASPSIVDYDSYFFPLDSIDNWNRVYGRRGFLQYQFVIPSAHARQNLPIILKKLTSSRLPSFLAVLKRFGKQGEGMLSFPREGITLALDLPNAGEKVFYLLDELDNILLKCNGKVYLAKDARLKNSAFYAMYPRYNEWRQIKNLVDPHDTFSSDLSRRLHIGRLP